MRPTMSTTLAKDSVLKNVLRFSLPYLLSYFLQTLYGMADLLIIGRFDGVAATTAVSIGSQVMHMVTVMIVGLAMGVTVGIGHAVGAGEQRRAGAVIGNGIVMFMALSVVLAAVLCGLVRPLTAIMSTPTEALAGTQAYLTICFVGIPCITAYNIIASIFRGLGDSKSPMYFIAVACAANIGLDFLFMGAMHLGPAGAALGTTLSQAISVAVSLVVILKRKFDSVALQKQDFRPRRAVIWRILRIGVPVALQDGLIQVSFLLITIIANRRGLTDAAAVGVVEKFISFVFLVPSSMLSTVSALGAQEVGAGRHDRAAATLRYGIGLTLGFGAVVGVLVQFIAPNVVGLFTTDAAVIAAGAWYLRGYIWDCFFAGVHFSFSGYFCAYGRSELSFIHNILSTALVRVPGAYFMSKWFPDTLLPMGLATVCGSVLSVCMCLVLYTVLKKRGVFGSVCREGS